ncbi:hypothetical protein [Enterococcus casseliflavus]|uniref:hypothetical protein n=1 Tax=Enterococcus casseliflavus TaxID=37734 RepID=UPI0030174AE2
MDNNTGTRILSIVLKDEALEELKNEGFTYISGDDQYDEIMLVLQSHLNIERNNLLKQMQQHSGQLS